MKDRKTMKSGMIWLLLSVSLAVVMVLTQTPARAAVTCPTSSTADSDGDGFTDAEECNGMALADGTHFPGYSEHLSNPSLQRNQYLDPNSKDLFVILKPASPSNFPSDPLQYVYTGPDAAHTLPITFHLIQPEQATSNADYTLDRIVSPLSTLKQKAVRFTEDLTPYNPANKDALLGNSAEGTPNGLDDAVIYSARIKGKVQDIYAGNNPPIPYPSNLQDIIDRYMRHIFAHELGHMIGPLAPVTQADVQNFGGYHYKSDTTQTVNKVKYNVIMDQYVTYNVSVSNGTVTFKIGTIYTSADVPAVTLR